ncbi:hypothetical protein [Cellulomonas sp. URHD0024]|uniref:hypothetical protein n=1 Tax=Cellulomonas sp. URHD0024 TaxID=1302620 RepID=UPI00041CF7E4|nr:hypothetical protein [Cellulomonas sp. URHD0024]
MVAQRDVLDLLRDAAVRALDESWDIHLPSTLLERAWVAALRSLRSSLRGTWGDLGLDVLLRGPARDQRTGPSDALVFGMALDAFVVALGAASEDDDLSAEDVVSAADQLLDRSRYREADLAGPATHAGIDVVRAAHTLLGLVLGVGSFARVRELTANAETLEWEIQDRLTWEKSSAANDPGARRSILERLPIFRGLRPRRPSTAPEHELHRGPHVNVAVLAAAGPAEHLPRVRPGSRVWLAVNVGPHADDAANGLRPPLTLPKRVRRELVDVVILADGTGDKFPVAPPPGQLRMSADGPFTVTRPAGIGPAGKADSLRLYFALQAPTEPGDWRVRCVLSVRGLIVHVEQVNVVVAEIAPGIAAQSDAGSSGEPVTETTAETTFRLVEDMTDPESLEGIEAPTLALYASCDDGRQNFSFLLSDDAGVEAAQVHFDPERVAAFIDTARVALDEVTWVIPEPDEQGAVTWYSWNWAAVGDPSQVASHLVALARTGRLVWGDLAEGLAKHPSFVSQLREAMRTPGSVQVALKDSITHVIPVQFLYYLPLRTDVDETLRLCDATKEWLAANVDGSDDAEEPPCVAGTCPQEGDDSRVCIAGFLGYRHRVTSDLDSATALSELDMSLTA